MTLWALAAVLAVAPSVVPPAPEVERREEAPPEPAGPPRYYLRAAVETAALLALGSAWYWRKPSSQADDWELKFDWSSWRRKLDLDAVRFDTNLFTTNSLSHPISGSVYFHAARENGLPFYQSYVSAFIASDIWEYFSEYKELPSLNDIIMTPAGGAMLGEATYRLGRLFAAARPTLVNRIGAWVFSPIASFNDRVAGRRPGGAPTMYHRLSFELGAERSRFEGSGRRDELSLTLGSAVVAHPGYRQPGQGSAAVGAGDWTALSMRWLLDDGPRGFGLSARSLFAGRYLKSYGAPRHGAGLLLGLGGSFDADFRALEATWDRIASVGLVGPALELTLDRSWFELRLSASATYSFAMLQSLAFARYGQALAASMVKSSLRSGGYYYGHGLTSRAALTLALDRVELALAGDLGLYRSLEGRDRFQERLDGDAPLSDVRAGWSAQLSLRLLSALRVAARLERIRRESHLQGRTASAGELRLGVSSIVVF